MGQPDSRPDPEAGFKGILVLADRPIMGGAHFEALYEGVPLVPLEPRYTQSEFNLISVQVCLIDIAIVALNRLSLNDITVGVIRNQLFVKILAIK